MESHVHSPLMKHLLNRDFSSPSFLVPQIYVCISVDRMPVCVALVKSSQRAS